MNSIFARVSDRQYTDQPIDRRDMRLILRAAFCAPSSRNRQPLELIVVKDKAMLEKLSEVSPYATPVKGSAMTIVVCANTERNDLIGACVEDCAAATENMLIEATELHIGSCWIGCWPHEERTALLARYMKTPENIRPLWMVSFGYPVHKASPKDKWSEEKISYESYGQKEPD